MRVRAAVAAIMLVLAALAAGCERPIATPSSDALAMRVARDYIGAISRGDAPAVERMTESNAGHPLIYSFNPDNFSSAPTTGTLLQKVRRLSFAGYEPGLTTISAVEVAGHYDSPLDMPPGSTDRDMAAGVRVVMRWNGRPATLVPVAISVIMRPDGSARVFDIRPDSLDN